ncbi:hypothetical protein D3C72_1095030 [compost metagenome]
MSPVALDVGRGALALGNGDLRPGDAGVEVADVKGPDDEALEQLVLIGLAGLSDGGQIALHIGAVLGHQFIAFHVHPIPDAGQLAQPDHVLL